MDEGCSALDEVDGFLPVALTMSPPVNTTAPTTTPFVLTCSAVDRAGNVGTTQRRIAVRSPCVAPSFLCPLPSVSSKSAPSTCCTFFARGLLKTREGHRHTVREHAEYAVGNGEPQLKTLL